MSTVPSPKKFNMAVIVRTPRVSNQGVQEMVTTRKLWTVMTFAAGLGVALVAVFAFRAWRVDASPADSNVDMTFVPITPCRLLDTRPGADRIGDFSAFGPDETKSIPVTSGNCTSSIYQLGPTALSLNVTAVGATKPTFITIWPHNSARPLASSLNPTPGEPPTPNEISTGLYAGYWFDIYNRFGTVDLVVDVNGYYSSSGLNSIRSRLTELETPSLTGYSTAFSSSMNTPNLVQDTEVVLSLDVTAAIYPSGGYPGAGTTVVNYQATVYEPDVGESVRCVIATPDQWQGALPPDSVQDFVSTGSYGNLAGTMAFDQPIGSTRQYQLKCDSTNGASIRSAVMTATYIAPVITRDGVPV